MTVHGEVPLSAILAETVADEDVTLGELLDRLARRGFGVLMIALALPTLIPVLPPGTAAFIGLLYIILAVQMLIGLNEPWLPARLRRYRLSYRTIAALRERGVPLLRRIERFSRPRLLFLDDRITARAVAAVVLVLGIVLLSPVPFLNTLPAVAVLLLGIGQLNRDAVFLLAGLLLGVVVALIIVFGVGSLYALFNLLRRRL
ncbi:MAG: exopolysaccharide biosynthesis protein [Armatimonadota bacterium]|nr:exopolysaccharide biosynthesis protein [Armatimonadota bacterium]MDR7451836.1 exopolysaccharide biosynthesis protein [Armatimonadota bacterium]MDR7494478.1 exopolysaccharide biosynthesis protein [Armatimonadota bacterium]MDR7499739.1 exopolysaccharide biosynthesis protein [Armatimonadota bacterium]MDR7504976.1 exopolysaccharide biosynthesis protein [Armatimonadota bacterium]